MNLVTPLLPSPVIIQENQHTVVVIENQAVFSNLVLDLLKQEEGQPGEVVLYDDFEPVALNKRVQLVTDPFRLEVNNKKVLNAVYDELKKRSVDETHYMQTAGLTQQIQEYIETILQELPYVADYDTGFDMAFLFRLVDLQLGDEDSTLCEKILNYIQTQHRFLQKDIFVFVNLKAALLPGQIAELYKAAEYEKVFLLLLEAHSYEKVGQNEHITILDQDLCEITG